MRGYTLIDILGVMTYRRGDILEGDTYRGNMKGGLDTKGVNILEIKYIQWVGDLVGQ